MERPKISSTSIEDCPHAGTVIGITTRLDRPHHSIRVEWTEVAFNQFASEETPIKEKVLHHIDKVAALDEPVVKVGFVQHTNGEEVYHIYGPNHGFYLTTFYGKGHDEL